VTNTFQVKHHRIILWSVFVFDIWWVKYLSSPPFRVCAINSRQFNVSADKIFNAYWMTKQILNIYLWGQFSTVLHSYISGVPELTVCWSSVRELLTIGENYGWIIVELTSCVLNSSLLNKCRLVLYCSTSTLPELSLLQYIYHRLKNRKLHFWCHSAILM
jgi:hypothetical protein